MRGIDRGIQRCFWLTDVFNLFDSKYFSALLINEINIDKWNLLRNENCDKPMNIFPSLTKVVSMLSRFTN